MIETSIPFFFAVFFLKKTSTYKHIYTYVIFASPHGNRVVFQNGSFFVVVRICLFHLLSEILEKQMYRCNVPSKAI